MSRGIELYMRSVVVTGLVLGTLGTVSAQDGDPSVEAAEDAPEATSSDADDPRLVEARERIARGEQLFEDGNYESALAEFLETFELLRGHQLRYLVLYNMAKCQERLFLYSDAMDSYRAFLEQGGAFSELEGEVRAKLDMLEGLLGTVRLTVNVRAYEVWLDDRRVGTNVDSILVPGGAHKIEVRAEGYVPSQQEVQVAARSERSVSFELTRLADEFEGLSPALFWTSVGVAVVAAGVGAGFGIKAMSDRGTVNDRTPSLATNDEVRSIRRSARNADIFFGVAGAAAITAVIFALFTRWGNRDDEDPAAAQLRLVPSVGIGGASLDLAGSF